MAAGPRIGLGLLGRRAVVGDEGAQPDVDGLDGHKDEKGQDGGQRNQEPSWGLMRAASRLRDDIHASQTQDRQDQSDGPGDDEWLPPPPTRKASVTPTPERWLEDRAAYWPGQ